LIHIKTTNGFWASIFSSEKPLKIAFRFLDLLFEEFSQD